MNASFRNLVTLLFALAGLASPHSQASARAVEGFDKQTWRQLQAGLTQPAAVVFTTTDCAYCPAVMDRLSNEIHRRKLNAKLVAVVMDVAPGENDRALMRDKHYRRADRLLAFSGQAPPIRYAINPAWQGVTPYVAFLIPDVPPVWVTGQPSDADIRAWVHAMATSSRHDARPEVDRRPD